MRYRFDIIAFVGVGPVRFGASRDAVRAAMGSTPVSFQKGMHAGDPLVDAWFENSLHVFYHRSTDAVECIEIFRGGPVAITLHGHDLLATPASDLIPELDRIRPFDRDVSDPGYSFVFQDWQVSLWRPALPEDDEEDARFFAAAGAAVSGHFKRPVAPIPFSREGGE